LSWTSGLMMVTVLATEMMLRLTGRCCSRRHTRRCAAHMILATQILCACMILLLSRRSPPLDHQAGVQRCRLTSHLPNTCTLYMLSCIGRSTSVKPSSTPA
jgi:hypothetical protein